MGKRAEKSYKSIKNTIQQNASVLAEDFFSTDFSTSKYQKQLFQYSALVGNVGVCHINLHTKEIFLSDKLFRLIGYEPGSFIPTLRNLFRFIHYDDKVRFFKLLSMANDDAPHINKNMRLLNKNGHIKHVNFTVKTITEDNQKIILLGFTDLTEEINSTQMLTEEIANLKKENSQLLAFNEIAGHDLQSPIRKIQMFISKMHHSAEEPLPDQVTKYLHKIDETSRQMQYLVQDLLSFTNTSQKESAFQKTSLEVIVQEALLEVDREENHFKISVDPLPSATVIPFQF